MGIMELAMYAKLVSNFYQPPCLPPSAEIMWHGHPHAILPLLCPKNIMRSNFLFSFFFLSSFLFCFLSQNFNTAPWLSWNQLHRFVCLYLLGLKVCTTTAPGDLIS